MGGGLSSKIAVADYEADIPRILEIRSGKDFSFAELEGPRGSHLGSGLCGAEWRPPSRGRGPQLICGAQACAGDPSSGIVWDRCLSAPSGIFPSRSAGATGTLAVKLPPVMALATSARGSEALGGSVVAVAVSECVRTRPRYQAPHGANAATLNPIGDGSVPPGRGAGPDGSPMDQTLLRQMHAAAGHDRRHPLPEAEFGDNFLLLVSLPG
eukprot:GHVU01072352.1.p1 GENE.GHVU01072352.1~~GHVU01072352.1.p1  ORF type:complete len:211 (-),score=14.41 GHVU01072352.1:295-927(-)